MMPLASRTLSGARDGIVKAAKGMIRLAEEYYDPTLDYLSRLPLFSRDYRPPHVAVLPVLSYVFVTSRN